VDFILNTNMGITEVLPFCLIIYLAFLQLKRTTMSQVCEV